MKISFKASYRIADSYLRQLPHKYACSDWSSLGIYCYIEKGKTITRHLRQQRGIKGLGMLKIQHT